jgi:hypothetical protein
MRRNQPLLLPCRRFFTGVFFLPRVDFGLREDERLVGRCAKSSLGRFARHPDGILMPRLAMSVV